MSNNGPTISVASVDGFVVGKFDDLYRTEYVPMVKLARGLVDSSERAEEIVQDAFAKVFERWNRLNEPGGYLRVSVINGSRSELRKREVSRRLGLTRRTEAVAEERDYLIDALDQLPAKQKNRPSAAFFCRHVGKGDRRHFEHSPGNRKEHDIAGAGKTEKGP